MGASLKTSNELKFLYENHEDFSGLPTYFIQPALIAMMSSSYPDSLIPGKTIDPSRILHGEQYLEIVNNPPLEGRLLTKSKVVEVLDKGSGAALVTEGTHEIAVNMI